MEENNRNDKADQREIHSKAVRAGKRTYFFDVRKTKKGDLYLSVTESKRHWLSNGAFRYEKHKIFLYKEDFDKYTNALSETIQFIKDDYAKRGIEVLEHVSERKEEENSVREEGPGEKKNKKTKEFTDVDFDSLGEESNDTGASAQIDEEETANEADPNAK